jgi:putative membrane protein insertion efficiency factor
MNVFRSTLAGLPATLLIAAVRLYQITLSPVIGQSCRFQPTCSNYMIEAVRKYGFWRGAWRGIRRVARCHPLHAGGYDPP